MADVRIWLEVWYPEELCIMIGFPSGGLSSSHENCSSNSPAWHGSLLPSCGDVLVSTEHKDAREGVRDNNRAETRSVHNSVSRGG